ncbi:glycyl-radical enzyme activating protein [Eubacteriaceae bacterium ES3]|nr:glycyl-radical enzyme activating protein [Eubacteriaceae bacterium ES3]
MTKEREGQILGQSTNELKSGTIFNIQTFTVHDGPGIRTEVFMKGCPYRCKWCSNPESFKASQEIGLYSTRCIGISKCGDCLKVCHAKDALVVEGDFVVEIDKNNCDDCMECAKVCPSNALQFWGKKMSVEEVMEKIRPDKNIYKKSGGGVTFSGGEALVQWEFVLETLKACKNERIHTCVETALHCKPEVVDEIIPYTDLFISDIKHMNSEKHKEYTGIGNELTLSNIKKVIDADKPVIIRIPVVPNHNDDMENMENTAKFIVDELGNKVKLLQLLRFRRLGEEKYKSLSMKYPMEDEVDSVNIEEAEDKNVRIVEMFKSYGVNAVSGSTSDMSFNKIQIF